ncbi:MAG: hypothetical protein E7265_01550 [Lachnospiraceae bacterium]|nr:hypothetical protein [Lachnospiraceae bacterium]
MLDNLLTTLKNIFKSRLIPIVIIYVILFFIVVVRMFTLQIVKGDTYIDKTITTTKKERDIKGSRGKIYDCNGKLLASNELSYNVIIEDTGEVTDNAQKNAMIHKMLNIIKKNGDKVDISFPIKLSKDNKLEFSVDENSVLRFKRDAYFVKSVEELTEEQINATAEEMFEYMKNDISSKGPKFDISDEYTTEEALDIMKIRYSMLINSYTKYIPIIVSSEVKNSTVIAIKENCAEMPGVSISEDTKRLYYDSKYFSNIIGYTGAVTNEELEELEDKDDNYSYNISDQIGKTGIESSMESVLRGEKGKEALIIDNNSRIIENNKINDPVAGNDIYLTIDADLQKACYDILEKKLAGILISKINNSTDAGTKGESASDIRIPIYDVFNSLIHNNIIDTNHFKAKKASQTEKKVYKTFKNNRKIIINNINRYLKLENKKSSVNLSDEYTEYLKYIYSMLSDSGLLKTDEIDTTDKHYTDYYNGKTSLSSFLEYSIINNYIDFDILDIGDKFYTTAELYDVLREYIIGKLKNNVSVDKLIYKHMIYNYKITGKDLCIILIDQKIVSGNKEDIRMLDTGMTSSYDFIIGKIKKLELTPAMLALDPCSGSVVITDVNTGKVKAYVTYPTYDNNKFANMINSEYYNVVMNNSSYPLMNRPSMQKTAPGSTFKMVTSAAALEEIGILSSPGEKIMDKHTFKEVNPSPKCWSNTSHGKINVSDALKHSCNYYYYEIGYRLGLTGDILNHNKGLNTLEKYATMFGLNKPSGIELSEAAPQISDTDCVRSAIGQGTNSFTPAGLARYVTTIANSGICYDLTLIDKIHKTAKDKFVSNKAKVHNNVNFSSTTWTYIHNGMRKVITGGSVASLFKNVKIVDVAGKTGTAQENVSKPNHALFVSYAPYDNPEISMTTVIPNGYTSGNAAELARDIYIYYYDKDKRKEILNSKVTKPENQSHAFSD